MLDFNVGWNNIYKIAKTLSRKKCVTLALYCAELVNAKDKYTTVCIDLVQKWLDNPESVTQEQLRKAARRAYPAGSYSAWATASVDYAFWSAHAAINVFHTKSKTIAGSEGYKIKTFPYLEALVNAQIPKTPFTNPLEIIIYLQDQLEYPILDGNRLNLWSKEYEYQVTGSIEEMANTLGIRNLLLSGE